MMLEFNVYQIQLGAAREITPTSSCPQPWNKSSIIPVLPTLSYKRNMIDNNY